MANFKGFPVSGRGFFGPGYGIDPARWEEKPNPPHIRVLRQILSEGTLEEALDYLQEVQDLISKEEFNSLLDKICR